MSEWATAWALARREVDLKFRGLRLLLACLFLGVGALAAIGSLTQAIERELAARGGLILGGDIEFSVSQRGAAPDERAAMAALGTLSETASMQATAVGGSAGDPTIVPIELKAVDGAYPLYGALTLAGDRPARAPGASKVYIAPALAERLALTTGGRFRIGSADFTIGGIIANEPDRLGEGFTLGPVAIVSTDGLERTGLIQPGSMYTVKYRVKLSGGDAQAAIDRFKARFPAGGWEAKTRDRAAPGAARFVERMGQF